ncbi:subtilisin family serine protease [Nakamurella flavida]|uniref:S8 family peptidase n=1 Tax=Nakamurella flavida TaxID=363630 RepID=UPI0027876829|nr:S8 family serine peptidase [Nakamurella flavida]MDP9778485.1 subtilisin family serine protease [Nakamurella flavida]
MTTPLTPASGPTVHTLDAETSRPRQYLVARRDGLVPLGMTPLDAGTLLQVLTADPAVEVVRTLRPRLGVLAAGLGGDGGDEGIVVATMSAETAAQLARHPQVMIEEDELLHPVLDPLPTVDPMQLSPFGLDSSWSITVVGPAGEPVVGAAVYVYGSGSPVQGTTDERGSVTVSLTTENDATVRSVFVNPRSGYWNLWLDGPDLLPGRDNRLTVQPLSSRLPDFPTRQSIGWGQRLMRMDLLPAGFDGAGVHVAVVDSGAAALTHPDLLHVTHGQDLTVTPPTADGWQDDLIAHGSHCSGVIAGADAAGGIRGFAPAATLHELRVFPGGRLSSLLDALDHCLDNGIDVVNMSLGGGGSSALALAKLREARDAGIVCVVAAGNSGGPVSFPGTSPDVITVAAMGKTGEYPESSYHARLPWSGGPVVGGLFSAEFSCHGPEVDVCAPGVAVLSSVPADGYACWDGTSMAAPHVAGLAALVLAHHPDLQGAPRNAARVDRVRELILGSAVPLDVGDGRRTGAGVPDAPRALGLGPDRPAAGTVLRTEVDELLDRIRAGLVLAGLG